jgi:hypothetical protein
MPRPADVQEKKTARQCKTTTIRAVENVHIFGSEELLRAPTDTLGRWKQNNRETQQYRILISMSGFSPKTTVLACRILNPDHVVVIHSRNTGDSYDLIRQNLVGGEGSYRIRPQNFKHFAIDPTQPPDTYITMRDEITAIQHH